MSTSSITPQPLSDRDRIDVLLEEYRALYSLLTFRIGAMDQHLPMATGLLATLLGAVPVMPRESKLLFLLGLPFSVVWLMRMVVTLARSKEDVLRRIDEIEVQVNHVAGERLLIFQSTHPNRKRAVAGRTGTSVTLAILSACLGMLIAAHFVFYAEVSTPGVRAAVYDGYLLAAASCSVALVARLARYRYQKHISNSPMVNVALKNPDTEKV